ncbi:helix-turn-helix domain-containing protein [Streptomyces marincola]|uniref:helix-turn-helix domain-containing protein n=1 Tax=Streptomyces marincola TaxID=2878388 RepID=UPI001CF36BFB|nr:helix-turn-helix transcriptional regulator [Streptomyces marincola]UCM89930.1 helix-turn-helix domain-containing protein [Streptomyces marincola]
MPDHFDEHIGTRLRELRKRRGLTQRELANHSGVSLSTIRNVEQGTQTAVRLETVRKLASALRTRTSILAAREPSGQENAPTAVWDELRRAVEQPHGDLPEPPTVDGVEEALRAARAAYFADDFDSLAARLPVLLRDADSLGDASTARDVRARLLGFTGSVLTQVRQWRAADTALERALDAAPDAATAAGIINTRCWLLLRQGHLTEARETATRWADDVEPRRVSRATPDDLAAWGFLLLKVAAASIRDNRPGEADTALKMAQGAAVITGRDLGYGRRMNRWSPTIVAHKRVEHLVITEQPDRALALADQTAKIAPRHRLPSDGNANRHLLDTANAHAQLRDYGEAMGTLLEVHRRAPSWLANQRYARDILGNIVAKRRTLTPEMRMLAEAIELPV